MSLDRENRTRTGKNGLRISQPQVGKSSRLHKENRSGARKKDAVNPEESGLRRKETAVGGGELLKSKLANKRLTETA